MFIKKSFILAIVSIGVFGALAFCLFAAPLEAQAQTPVQFAKSNQCFNCHEDLYYLHDTGKAYCLKDSPMQCVDCHGGDPTAMTAETAHENFIKHPILNADDSKCYQCHPDQAQARVEKFRQLAGVKPVMVAVSHQSAALPVTASAAETQPGEWILGFEAISLFLVAGLALTIFIFYKIRHG
jgi:hypothetical protein